MRGPKAAEVAVQVDRLVVVVHRMVFGQHREERESLADRAELESPGQLFDLAEFALAGRCTREVAALRFRYHDRSAIDPAMRDLANPALPDLLRRMLGMSAVVAQSLWGDDLAALLHGAAEVLACATGQLTDGYKQLPTPEPSAHRLHHLLTGLRYARMDAHAAAWAAAGLAAGDIAALSAAVQGKLAPAPPRIIERGWMTAAGAVTPAGRNARTGIEVATNEACEPMLAALSEPSDWYEKLVELPS